ncbi:hypothetical protein [Streptomyces sp. NBC_01530]|uniref:hypothetical protein n=1 Tax=Streptomyces sp. NBC_01530 TaxID=2903895 RepID=UPI00386E9BE8
MAPGVVSDHVVAVGAEARGQIVPFAQVARQTVEQEVRWRQQAGGKAAGALTAAYVAAFGASHPLAKKVGAWPAVFGVAGAVALASWAVADRHV